MEGLFFLADIILMLMLVFSIFRGERKAPPGDLGLFAYKPDPANDKKPAEDERRA
jgi:hypothetical protein